MSWKPRTMRTDPRRGGNVLMKCGLCPRRTNADMMLRLTVQAQQTLGTDATHICDACRERVISTGRIDRDELLELVGAPADVVAEVRAFAQRHGDPPASRARRAAPPPRPPAPNG